MTDRGREASSSRLVRALPADLFLRGCPDMAPHTARSLGDQGEALACRELQRRGYAILACGYRTRFGEIDIVARDGPVLVFAEVKTRTTPAFGGPLVAVTPRKQQRLIRMALDYLVRHRLDGTPCRFDVVAVHVGERETRVEVVRDAFGG